MEYYAHRVLITWGLSLAAALLPFTAYAQDCQLAFKIDPPWHLKLTHPELIISLCFYCFA